MIFLRKCCFWADASFYLVDVQNLQRLLWIWSLLKTQSGETLIDGVNIVPHVANFTVWYMALLFLCYK